MKTATWTNKKYGKIGFDGSYVFIEKFCGVPGARSRVFRLTGPRELGFFHFQSPQHARSEGWRQ